MDPRAERRRNCEAMCVPEINGEVICPGREVGQTTYLPDPDNPANANFIEIEHAHNSSVNWSSLR